MPFQDQVICIYAGTRGYLDKLAISDVGPFQEKLLALVKSSHPAVLTEIAEKGAISSELDAKMKEIFTAFTAEFSA